MVHFGPSRVVHENLGELTPAIFREWRALPSAPRSEGHAFENARHIHPLRSQVCDKWGALCQKCDFGTRKKF